MTTIYDVLADLRDRFSDNAARGAAFERLTQQYLLADPLYAGRFGDVWLWQDWPGRDGKVDTGIDVVAETVEGGLVAVQCKFYDEHHPVTKADIDTFLSASGKHPFTERLVVSTTDKWSKHAEDALADQQIPVARIGVADLAESAVDWSAFQPDEPSTPLTLATKKDLYPHQQAALNDVFDGFATHDRGKLIMACGTGKTFTSLKIAERATKDLGDTSHILFLVPSISLLNQTLREWTAQTALSIRSYAVCSDTKVGKRATEDIAVHDLQIPATTDPVKLAEAVTNDGSDVDMVVVFSTYQSIEAVAAAQDAGVPDFDLIICDEAHRTTGVTLVGEDESAFVRVHDEDFIAGDKRLYMTATPRIFADETKSKAAEHDALLCSMDDPDFFGPEFHRLGFGDAVTAGLLTDYKVLVLNVDEGHVSRSFQQQLATDGELNIEDAARIIGCWNGLAKRGTALLAGDGFGEDTIPMRRAVAFSRSIKDSKAITTKFAELIHHYTDGQSSDDAENVLRCELEHVDGTDNALVRNERLAWLKADVPENTCRILSNARCLSEGVDVPDLDAVLFLNPRNSVVDVVQSVGRVMRRSEGKKYGYIILPVAIPEGVDPATALSDNKRYKVVWQVLQALRAHDDRFNAMVNQIELNKRKPGNVDVIGVGDSSPGPFDGDGLSGGGDDDKKPVQGMLDFPVDDWRDAIYGKIVAKVGERTYWEQWADDIRQIAERHVTRINTSIADPANEAVFNEFVEELQSNLNPGITSDAAIDMLAQHLITKPVFDALFGSYEFSERNPVSRSMADMLELLDDEHVESEAKTLNRFYDQVRVRAEGIDNHEGRQKVITELYEQFFKKALPKTADAFGIVYTPIEIVDFILRAVNDALIEHFDTDLSAEGVQILDPFTGTGTFIVRLLQSGLIRPEDLLRKYTQELHANEILLLAYYIAAVNIEATFEQVDPEDEEVGDGIYVPFDGIVLTDTFQLAESADTLDAVLFPENNKRVARQKAQDIRVIIGNPPYSAGQTSSNDDNRNQSYPGLDARITETYAAQTSATLTRTLYDSYIRAFRWASDRLRGEGVVGFVSNGGWLDSNSADGFRKCLAEEFDHIYVFNLRGNQRTAGEKSRKEGGKVFGSGSRSTVAITLLVRTGGKVGCTVHYRDIGDYLTAEEKLEIVDGSSLATVEWSEISPNEWGDWINQRDPNYSAYTPMGSKAQKNDSAEVSIFDLYSLGASTGKDAWCWGYSRPQVGDNCERMIENFNEQVASFAAHAERMGLTSPTQADVDSFVDYDPAKISWSDRLRKDVLKGSPLVFDEAALNVGGYRPFCKQIVYLDRRLTERPAQQPRIFPPSAENVGITLTGKSSHFDFCCLIGDTLPDLHRLDSSQFFPRHRYEVADESHATLFESESEPVKVDNITDDALDEYRRRHGDDVTKDDIFFYIYGLLHSDEYRTRYAADLGKALPRIPHVKDFQAFVDAGRTLADLHLNYETATPYPLDDPSLDPDFAGSLRVKKMKYPKVNKVNDRTRIIFNTSVTLAGIPEEAHRYMLGPRSAVEWIMDQYQVKTDKKSGITNDPNDWCDEHDDPRYIIDLIKRVVTVSVETMKIVDSLPDLDILD